MVNPSETSFRVNDHRKAKAKLPVDMKKPRKSCYGRNATERRCWSAKSPVLEGWGSGWHCSPGLFRKAQGSLPITKRNYLYHRMRLSNLGLNRCSSFFGTLRNMQSGHTRPHSAVSKSLAQSS